MRLIRIRHICIACITFLIWVTIFYATVINRMPEQDEKGKAINNRLEQLEDGIREQRKLNKELIGNLHNIIEQKRRIASEESEKHGGLLKDVDGPVIPVLVLACNRVSVSRCLDQLLQYRPNPDQFPVIVSQVSSTLSVKMLSLPFCF